MGSAKVLLSPSENRLKTLACVLEALKDIFISVGYTIDGFSLHSDSGLIEIVLYFKLGAKELRGSSESSPMALGIGEGG